MVKIMGIIWLIIILICAAEAYWCTKLDPESEKELKNRKNGNKISN